MKDDAEEKVSKFYNTIGWGTEGGIHEDTRRFENLEKWAQYYVSKCRLRVLQHIPEKGIYILDMASGPIQFKEYLEYSKNFQKRYCVDLSSEALKMAKRRIGSHGEFLHGSFFDISFEENFFDCAISLHTIYHINKDKQEEAVRKLVYVTKPEKPVIIVYINPKSLPHLVLRKAKRFKKKPVIKRLLKKPVINMKNKEDLHLYFYAHPIEWWNKFSDIANVNIYPWRSFSSNFEKKLIPNNKIGRKMFDILFSLEEKFPGFFVKNFRYSIIVLIKI